MQSKHLVIFGYKMRHLVSKSPNYTKEDIIKINKKSMILDDVPNLPMTEEPILI